MGVLVNKGAGKDLFRQIENPGGLRKNKKGGGRIINKPGIKSI